MFEEPFYMIWIFRDNCLCMIGGKTIDALLIYSLKRDDVFIYDDYHIQKVIPTLYGIEADKKLTSNIKELSKNWSPYSSHAFRYFLAWKEHSKKK